MQWKNYILLELRRERFIIHEFLCWHIIAWQRWFYYMFMTWNVSLRLFRNYELRIYLNILECFLCYPYIQYYRLGYLLFMTQSNSSLIINIFAKTIFSFFIMHHTLSGFDFFVSRTWIIISNTISQYEIRQVKCHFSCYIRKMSIIVKTNIYNKSRTFLTEHF